MNMAEFQFKEITQFWLGIIASIISSFSIAYWAIVFKQLHQANLLTLTHIQGLVVLIFLPIFYPLQKITSPTIVEWGFLVIFGVILEVIILALIRAIQLQHPSIILVTFSIGFSLQILIDLIFGRASFKFYDYLGCFISLIFFAIFTQSASEIKVVP